MTARRLAPVLILGLMVMPAAPASAAPERSWGATIHPDVLSRMEKGRPARVIVRLADTGDLSAARSIEDKRARRIAVVEEKMSTARRTQANLIRILESARAAGEVASFKSFWVANAIAVEASGGVVRALAAQPEVDRIDPDRRRHIIEPVGGTSDASPVWNIDLAGAPAAWDLGILGEGAVVSSIDTGVQADHPSIASRYRGAGGDENYAWWDAINGLDSSYDDNGHGTHTMGTMVGGDGPGPDANDIGVAPGATWIAAKAFDAFGGGADSWILDAAQFLAAPTKLDGSDPDPALAPDVVNNSWGGGQCDPWFDEVMETWRAMEIFPAFAIGNWGPDSQSASSPGDSALAFSVGATDIDDQIADFSSRGPTCDDRIKPEISAPGVDVPSSLPTDGFGELSGTSMATPHVAGTIALLLDASADSLTVPEMEALLREESLDLGDTGEDNDFGAGRLQIGPTVEIALQGVLVNGTVTDVASAPIAGVRLTFEGPERTRRVVTRSDGTYRARLLPGTYAVTGRAFGYLPHAGTLVIPDVGGELTHDITLALAPITTITGTVVEGPTLAPIAGASVRVLDTPLAPVTTLGDGSFSITLPEGIYDVRASSSSCLEEDETTITALGSPATATLTLPRKLDGYGYTCDAVAFVHEPGTSKLDLGGWEDQVEVDLPFSFPFYGEDLSSIWVTSTGYVTASEQRPTMLNAPIPSDSGPNGAMYLLWDGLFVRGSARGVYTATLGSAPDRRFVIEYRNFEIDETGDLVNAALVLFEDGSIEMRYRSVEGVANGVSGTVGIENFTGSSALQYSEGEAVLTDASAIRYSLGAFGTVTGTITSVVDGLPVEDALVEADGRTSLSASDGSYRIAAFPGPHDVTVSSAGYESVVTVQPFTYGSSALADVVLNAPGLTATPSALAFDSSGSTTEDIAITNPGNRTLTYEAYESHELLHVIAQDPAGDALRPEVDLVSIEAGIADDNAVFAVTFTDTTIMDYAGGYLQFDTDQNPSTGIPVEDQYGLPGQDIGIDYFATLFDLPYTGEIYVWDQDWNFVTVVPAEVVGARVSFAVPLTDLGGDDGAMDITSNVGDWEPLDWAPEAGHADSGGPAEVHWLTITSGSGELAPGGAATITVTVNPAGLTSGVHEAAVVLASNAPRSPKLEIPVTFEVEDASAPTTTITTQSNTAVVRPAGARVSGTATDTGAGVDHVIVTFVGLAGNSLEVATLTCENEDVRSSCDWTVEGPLVSGLYEVTAWAVDRDGHEEVPGAPITVLLI